MTRSIRAAHARWPLLFLVSLAPACGDDVPTEELTLDNCETSIASEAPAFFTDLYRCATVTTDGSSLTLETVNLPPHKTYYYGEGHPNYTEFDYSRGSEYKPNQFTLEEQELGFNIPLEPVSRGLTINGELVDDTQGTSDYEYSMGPVGIAIDGVAIFNPLAADGGVVDQEIYGLDSYYAHPQENGTYHYHTIMPGPLEVLKRAGLTTSTVPGQADVEIYGMMCDGTVLLGCTEADGSAVSGMLDPQGGHVTDITGASGTVWFTNRYHTHICETGRKYTPEIQYYSTCEREGGGPPAQQASAP
jgi:hypothetical protein